MFVINFKLLNINSVFKLLILCQLQKKENLKMSSCVMQCTVIKDTHCLSPKLNKSKLIDTTALHNTKPREFR